MIQTLTGHKDCVFSVCFSPDETKLVSGSDDEYIKIWNPISGDKLDSIHTGYTGDYWAGLQSV